MKRLCLPVLALCLCAAFFTACSKEKAAPAENQTETTDTANKVEAVPVQTPDVDGVMIAGWYYSLSSDENNQELMVAEYEAKVGSLVKLYSDDDAELKVVTKKDVAVDGGGKRDFVKVYSDDYDREFWVRDYAVVPYAHRGAVFEENIFLYTKPDLASIGTRIVEPLSIFAVFDEAPDGDADSLFYKVRYYINDGKTYTVNGYLLKNNVETQNPLFFDMIQCKEKIAVLEEEITKDEKSVDSYVVDELNEIYAYYNAAKN